MTQLHHTEDVLCPMCEDKLTKTHPDMIAWYRTKKTKYANLHISWSFRTAEEQNAMVVAGKSKLQWPQSKHNHTDPFGKPESLALDLFIIGEDGEAKFPKPFYQQLAKCCSDNHEPIRWGGVFKYLGDFDHFELTIPSANLDTKAA